MKEDQLNGAVKDGKTVVEAPITVLIIGETANGKSTLIRQLGVYSGDPNPKIEIGYGHVSCTKHVKSHAVATVLRAYEMRDHAGRKIKNVKYSDLLDYTEEDATASPCEAEQGGKISNFEFVDTPGLDDSGGNDMEIMSDIVGRIGELPHLNAVIYVRNLNKPFGSSFTSFYDYIQRCIPSLCNGLIIVHSGFTVDRIDEALSQKRDLTLERKEAFKKASRRNLNLAHFFMDNEPEEGSPFAVVESLNACYHLLKLLACQLPLNTKHMKLLKTPKMQNIDIHIILALERTHNCLKRNWDKELAAASRAKSQALRMVAEITRLRNKVNDFESSLTEIDTSSPVVLGTKSVSEDFGLKTLLVKGDFWLDARDVVFDSDYLISNVEKSASGGSKWHDENRRGTSWRAKISAGMFRSIHGSATFYTTTRNKHEREIDLLKKDVRSTQESIEFLESSLADTGTLSDGDQADSIVVKLGEDAQRCARTLDRVRSEVFEVEMWPLLKQFYTMHRPPTMGDVMEFVKIYDPETAELIYTIK